MTNFIQPIFKSTPKHSSKKTARTFTAFVLGLVLVAPSVMAEMVISTTRVVYPETRREVSFTVNNGSKERPALVQMWVDDGIKTDSPEDVVTPFNISPPIARVSAQGTQVVRVTYTGDPLPADRESLYWFNMLEVPPKSNAENRLSFAVRTRIKLFFRPKSIKGEQSAAMRQVTWKVVQQEKGWAVEGNNPTPFHMSFLSLNLGEPGKQMAVTDGGMIAPLARATFPITLEKLPEKYSQLVADFINDYGGVNSTPFAIPAGK
jgi:chaperone protein EcpD